MERASTVRLARSPVEVRGSAPKGAVQRKCGCGSKSAAGGSCEECSKEAVSLQQYSTARQTPSVSILRTADISVDDAALGGSETSGAVAGHSFGRVAAGLLRASRVQKRAVPVQPADRNDDQADQSAESTMGTAGSDRGPLESAAPASRVGYPLVQRAAMPGAAPGPAAPALASAPPAAAEPSTSQQSAAGALIVDDDTQQIGPGQMRKGAFLDQLQSSVCAAADA